MLHRLLELCILNINAKGLLASAAPDDAVVGEEPQ